MARIAAQRSTAMKGLWMSRHQSPHGGDDADLDGNVHNIGACI